MSTLKYAILIFFLFVCFLIPGCKKYLEEKQDQKLTVPDTVQDLQSLLDNWYTINQNFPEAGELSSDDYFLTYSDWSSRREYIRRTYTWEEDHLFEPGTNNGWSNSYYNAYIANTVLYHIPNVRKTVMNENEWNNTKGSANFLRGICFAQLAWIWSFAYDEMTSETEMGIPLRLDPDFNTLSTRSTVKQTYDQIIKDLKEAANYLPETPTHVIRPSKAAAYGWLARVYLSMRKYDSALIYSSKYLDRYSELLDFNSFDSLSDDPISSFNTEVIYHSLMNTPVSSSRIRIDSTLYNSYKENDLRKVIFFKSNGNGTYRFKGSYDGSNYGGNAFNGIATDEIYLIRAECFARRGDKDAALNDLNKLMEKRWKNNGTWTPFTTASSQDALIIILQERRKELIQRGLRWADIKRLNKEGANIILKRELNSTVYILSPNSPEYALPIPEDVIAITGMIQNPR